jgi:hypothetical protein
MAPFGGGFLLLRNFKSPPQTVAVNAAPSVIRKGSELIRF